MLKQSMKHKKGQQGFTLLEILVVVAIMGFLVAMVAPRFAGITAGTVDVVCDTNQQRLVQALSAWNEQNGNLPGGLVNLVDEQGPLVPATGLATGYFIPTNTNHLEFPDQGQATFFGEFVDRNKFALHILNAAEVAEMRGLGVGTVHSLNAYNYDGTIGTHGNAAAAAEPVAEVDELDALRRTAVRPGMAVLMTGLGAESDADDPAFAGDAIAAAAGILGDGTDDYDDWGNPEWFGRIILGVGPDSALVSQGMISAAGLCPGGINNPQVFWNNYSVVLPRLEATVERMEESATAGVAFLAGVAAESNGGSYRTFNLLEAQESFQFLTQCPEGHRWPTPDEFSEWTIYVGATPAELEDPAALF
ncbi:type II secretion system protein [Desulfonatronum thioautotrophicum]|uniref:type II secretion system protein n=1 Tax=Desulfonatronum thioautotrophicum TaxID=617001 RepID=UPI00069BC8F9|nr:type II secretion system protein [Desulfonatronum thioautotrophicum]